MDEYVTLYDVIDTRTNQEHSVAVVKEKNVRYFVPAAEGGEHGESEMVSGD